MNYLVRSVLGLALGICLAFGSFRIGAELAHADTPQIFDAGSLDPGSGSAVSTVPALTLPPTITNPAVNPAEYFTQLDAAKSQGWGVAVLVGMFGLVELLAAVGSKVQALAFLGKGRISIVIAAATAILATSINALAAGGKWMAVGFAALSSLFLYLHPAATDVAIAKATKASA